MGFKMEEKGFATVLYITLHHPHAMVSHGMPEKPEGNASKWEI